MDNALLAGNDDLQDLPGNLRDALIAVTVFGFISIVTTAFLITYITYRAIRWKWMSSWRSTHRLEDTDEHGSGAAGAEDLSLGLEERHYHQLKVNQRLESIQAFTPTPRSDKFPPSIKRDTSWNPVLILVYALLYADLLEALAFLLSIVWVQRDGVFADTRECWTQGFAMQTGKLVSSGMLVLISISTVLAVDRGYKLSRPVVYGATAGVWILGFMLPVSGVLATRNGERDGTFYYSRAGAWCWVNVSKYKGLSVYLEYLWIYISMAVTVATFTITLVSLYRQRRSAKRIAGPAMQQRERDEPPKPSGHHPAFLVYQIIYIICTMPLALGRAIAMCGATPGVIFYGISGSLIASHGWMNVLLWSTTIIFIGDKDIYETGLEKFAFVRTPHRRYGNMVFVSGGEDGNRPGQHETWTSRLRPWKPTSARVSSSSLAPRMDRVVSKESLQRITRGPDESGIQLEVVTSVTVEDADRNTNDVEKDSFDSSEKPFEARSHG